MNINPRQTRSGNPRTWRAVRPLACAALAIVCCTSTGRAQTFTWQGGSGNWFDNANWNDPAVTWTNGANRQAILQGTPGTINLGGQQPTTFIAGSVNATTPSGGIQINSSGTWALTSGTIRNSTWVFGQGLSGIAATLTLDDIVLTGTNSVNFLRPNAGGNTGTVVIENLAGSQAAEMVFWGGMTMRTNANTNLGGIGGLDFKDTVTFVADAPLTFNGLVKAAQVTYNVDSHAVRFGSMSYLGGSATRGITVNGSGTLSIGTWNAAGTTGTTVWTKSGTGTLAVDTLNNTGTNGVINNFNVSQGRMLFNGTSTNLGTVSVLSGATVGGLGSIGFSGTNVLSVAAGGFMTADIANGFDILGGLTLGTTGNGVQLFLTGTLPSANSTFLSYSGGLTGAFSKIRYGGTELQLGQPSEALGGGFVDVSGNSLVYLAVVPEPATLGMLAAGGTVLVVHHLRRRRRGAAAANGAGPAPGSAHRS